MTLLQHILQSVKEGVLPYESAFLAEHYYHGHSIRIGVAVTLSPEDDSSRCDASVWDNPIFPAAAGAVRSRTYPTEKIPKLFDIDTTLLHLPILAHRPVIPRY
ncbi:TPA: hypothetical protein ACKP59_006275, partial [Pseudomonas aeruginosa]